MTFDDTCLTLGRQTSAWVCLSFKVYYVRHVRPDGSSGWSGGRDLSSAATFTHQFCRALLVAWEKEYEYTSKKRLPSEVIEIQSDDEKADLSIPIEIGSSTGSNEQLLPAFQN